MQLNDKREAIQAADQTLAPIKSFRWPAENAGNPSAIFESGLPHEP
jgi:hypothetical protein